MFNYAPFLLRRRRFVWIVLLSMTCLITSVEAQHGGGGHGGGGGHSGGGNGGHSSGGHFGGGHSSRNRSTSVHSGGHFGWLHVNFRHQAAHRAAGNVSDALLARSLEPIRGAPAHPLPPTVIRTIPLESLSVATRKELSSSSWLRHGSRRFLGRFRCPHSSGCYFNGFNQVCFFEPLLPILTSSSYFGLQDYGFDRDAVDRSGELGSTDTVPIAAAANTESENPPSTPPASVSPPSDFRGKGLDPRFFLLILKNGTEQVVSDYWFSGGYIEYVSRDGSRSRVPIEALDLQETVMENSHRGLAFSVRSVPHQN